MKSEARQFINYHSACFNSKQFVFVKEIRNMQIKLNLNIIKELCWSLIFVISFFKPDDCYNGVYREC